MIRHHLPGPAGRRSLRQRDQRGASAVEFSLVIIPLFFVLYALISFGMMLALKQSITSASSEAARSVVGVPDDTSTPLVDERLAAAKAVVASRLDWLGSKYDPAQDLKVSWYDPVSKTCNYASPPATPPSPATICVKITYPYKNRPLVPPAPGLGLITPSTFGSEARVLVG
ncbi:MAG TPA: TadE/TadG family type IV pilus assembly protein [Acidimicrobiales bacterium]|nr:TadE/TadG family type IV pilus assembly protein [Acidimicrobiales bacterium]